MVAGAQEPEQARQRAHREDIATPELAPDVGQVLRRPPILRAASDIRPIDSPGGRADDEIRLEAALVKGPQHPHLDCAQACATGQDERGCHGAGAASETSCASGMSGSRTASRSTPARDVMSALTSSTTSQTFAFMPAITRPCESQKAMNSRCARSPRKTSSSLPVGSPTNSIPTSYWSEKKYGRRSQEAGFPSIDCAATAGWLSAFAQCSTRTRRL